jgi:hypothetical protein
LEWHRWSHLQYGVSQSAHVIFEVGLRPDGKRVNVREGGYGSWKILAAQRFGALDEDRNDNFVMLKSDLNFTADMVLWVVDPAAHFSILSWTFKPLFADDDEHDLHISGKRIRNGTAKVGSRVYRVHIQEDAALRQPHLEPGVYATRCFDAVLASIADEDLGHLDAPLLGAYPLTAVAAQV